MNQKTIEEYYKKLMHLKSNALQEIINDINLIDLTINSFNEENAIYVLDTLLKKHMKELKLLKKHIPKLEIVENKPGVYKSKSIDDEFNDLKYLRSCLIAIATKLMGFEDDYKIIIKSFDL